MSMKKIMAAACASILSVGAMATAAFAADTIQNGDFETGDMTGWTATGSIAENPVIDAETFWAEKIPYNRGGKYHFDGWTATEDEGAAYSLKSTVFTLGGSGFISFKMGGNAAAVKVFLEDGRQIAEYTNTEFKDVDFPHVENGGRWATMTTFLADLHDYIGANLYIELHDTGNPNGWGVAFFDDIVTKYDTAPSLESLNDKIKVYCIGKEDEAAEGRDYTLPAVKAANTVTNPPANPTPVKPDDNSKPSDDNSKPADDNNKPADNAGNANESNVNTGVESVAVVLGIAAVAGGVMAVSRKRK